MQLAARQLFAVKALVFTAALVPAGSLAASAWFFPERLGANPAEFITRATGDWTLRFLLLTLAVTPLRKLLGWSWLARCRRMLGLYAFFYGMLHMSSYVGFDRVFEVTEILDDIVKRPFIAAGFAALVLMTPLAITSADAIARRIGGRRWRTLHRLVYLISSLGVLHFWWMVKSDVTEPAIYAALLAALLGYRVAAHVGDWRAGAGGNAALRTGGLVNPASSERS
jgi:sulfoxide reductase heme-binding subunit YedZ